MHGKPSVGGSTILEHWTVRRTMNKVTRTMNSNKNNEHRTTNNTELQNSANSTLQVSKPCVYGLGISWGARWHSWLRHCATDREVPIASLGIFKWLNDMIYIYIFNRSWVDTRWQQYITHLHTNSTHNHSVSNRNKYHGYLLGGKGGRCVGLTTCCIDILGTLTSWSQWPFQSCVLPYF
jgi:hypothetical protein